MGEVLIGPPRSNFQELTRRLQEDPNIEIVVQLTGNDSRIFHVRPNMNHVAQMQQQRPNTAFRIRRAMVWIVNGGWPNIMYTSLIPSREPNGSRVRRHLVPPPCRVNGEWVYDQLLQDLVINITNWVLTFIPDHVEMGAMMPRLADMMSMLHVRLLSLEACAHYRI